MQDPRESLENGGGAAEHAHLDSSVDLVELLEERVRALVDRHSGKSQDTGGLRKKLKEQDLRIRELTRELQAMSKVRAKAAKQVELLIQKVTRLEAEAEKAG